MEQLHKQGSEREGSWEVGRARDLTQPVRGSHHGTASGDEREGGSRGQAGKEPDSKQARSSLSLLGQTTRLTFGELVWEKRILMAQGTRDAGGNLHSQGNKGPREM